MTEYWVSQAKYHCKVCNCYMADNKASRQHHENSIGHKSKVANMMKLKRQEKLHGARSEQDLKQQLAQIEQAALAAMKGEVSQDTLPRHPLSSRPAGYMQNQRDVQEAVSIQKEENSGIYSIRGKTYLDGTIFEEKLKTGTKCEIFVEEFDEWLSGSILSRHEMPVPHTNITLKSFDVSYHLLDESKEDGQGEVRIEHKIKSDRIRILASESTDPTAAIPYNETLPLPPSAAPRDELTGLGGWQTVSIKTVDEEEEQKAYEAAIEDMMTGNHKEDDLDDKAEEEGGGGSKKSNRYEHDEDDDGGGKKKLYKGYVVEDVPTQRKVYRPETANQDTVVQFKKRKITHPNHHPNKSTAAATVIHQNRIEQDIPESKEPDPELVVQEEAASTEVLISPLPSEPADIPTLSAPTVPGVPAVPAIGTGSGGIQILIKPKAKNFRKR